MKRELTDLEAIYFMTYKLYLRRNHRFLEESLLGCEQCGRLTAFKSESSNGEECCEVCSGGWIDNWWRNSYKITNEILVKAEKLILRSNSDNNP